MYAANAIVDLPLDAGTLIRSGLDPRIPPPRSEISGKEYGDVVLSLFERSGIGLAVADPMLRVRAVNDAFSEQCGHPREAVEGHSFAGFLDPGVRHDLLRQCERLVQGRHAGVAHSLAVRFALTGIAGRLTVFPVGDDHDRIRMLVMQFAPESLPAAPEQRKVTALTARILEGVAAGDSTSRLAAKLFLSRQGVEYHVSILLRQFQAPNRAALAARAYSMGIFGAGCWPPRVSAEFIR